MRKYLLVACAVALGACGGTSGSHVSLSQACPPGKSYMGCSEKTKAGLKALAPSLAPGGPKFPDVSNWQGNINWPAVAAWQKSHGWHPMAIWKLGEYGQDPYASRNSRITASLGFYRAGYWFVRNTGCSHEASQIEGVAFAEHLKIVIADSEVPESRGYSSCLGKLLRAKKFVVDEYSAPGTNPDGSNNPGLDVWVAAYGPSHVPCLFTCSVGVSGKQSILAFQFTDGQFGSPILVPGIGKDDVSVSYGIFKPVIPLPKPKPTPAPASTFNAQFTAGFKRGFTVHWDRRHHRPVPAIHSVVTPAWQLGYNAGYKSVHH